MPYKPHEMTIIEKRDVCLRSCDWSATHTPVELKTADFLGETEKSENRVKEILDLLTGKKGCSRLEHRSPASNSIFSAKSVGALKDNRTELSIE